MAECNIVPTGRIEPLTNKNYYVWSLKVDALLRSKKLYKEVIEADEPPVVENPESEAGKRRLKWEALNNEAFSFIILTLSAEQADIGLELKNLQMGTHETVQEYITRAKNIVSRSAALGQLITDRELTFHIVRGLNAKFERIASVLRAQRSLSAEEIEQVLLEEEGRHSMPGNASTHLLKGEKAYRATGTLGKINMRRRAIVITTTEAIAGNSILGNLEYAWTIDSGSTAHMTPHKEWMINVVPYKVEVNLAEENRSIHSEARGDIKIMTVTKESKRYIVIKDVLFIPGLRTNLLSVSQLVNTGNRVDFDIKGVKIISKEGILLGEAAENNGIYMLPAENRTSCYHVEDSSKDTCEEYLDTMLKKDTVRDLKYTPEKLKNCDACTMGKMTQYPHRAVGYSTDTRAYRIYDPQDRKIYATRTVKFRECIPGSTLIQDVSDDKEEFETLTFDNVNDSEKNDEKEHDEVIINHEITNQRGQEESETEEEDEDEIFEEAQQEIDAEIQQVPGRPGRKVGGTAEQFQLRRNIERIEREERLQTEGVRRSERLKNKCTQKSLYGLPQSGRTWNEKFDKTLKQIGLHSIPEDPCIYKMETGDRTIIIGIYVDDCMSWDRMK
ncbi:hypothetical protein KPH14_000894 [Odynerus spinipes]|uniref:Reverse transcriptase Ty1/copia-type domain-containing protein n=1 Tax=Odynerus spinipes TaxID=1348599 RepID=A0AAD9RD02_9HYME|nr:hypothetical protein KPH14_000894 [Odynerus spinipes]